MSKGTFAEDTVTGALQELPDNWAVVLDFWTPVSGTSKTFRARVQRGSQKPVVVATAHNWTSPEEAILCACAMAAAEAAVVRRVEALVAPFAGCTMDEDAMELLRREILGLEH